MTSSSYRVAMISAVPAAIPPAQSALERELPGVEQWNLLDDRLLQDVEVQGGLTAQLVDRMRRLIDHALTEGVDAVLLTCSVYAPVAHDVARDLGAAVYGPDDALFEAARQSGARSIVLVSSAEGPLADSNKRLARALDPGVHIYPVVADGAVIAARTGDVVALADSIEAAVRQVEDADAVVLGQYTLAPAAGLVEERVGIPVLAGPLLAARALRERLMGASS